MPRSIWKGSVSFGLVNIPVTLHPATAASERVHFRMLDERNMAPVEYKRVNATSGKEVPWDSVVKGFELEPDQYVIVEESDFQKAYPVSTKTVEILDFVDVEELPPTYFDKPYYLEPGKNGSKAYALLREVLRKTGKAGIAKVVIRTRQYLAAVIASGPVLLLEALRFAHELRDPEDLDLPGEDLDRLRISDRELAMAKRLVEGMSADWEPEKYKDEYTDAMIALIKHKAKEGGIEVIEEPEKEAVTPKNNVVDFSALLERSLERRREAEPPAKGRKRKPAKPTPIKRRTAARKSRAKTSTTAARRRRAG